MSVVITNCTNRKRGVVITSLSASSLDVGTVDDVAAQWIERLKNAIAPKVARNTYCGRSFREAESSAISLNAPLYIVSAGLGVVESNSAVPVYNLTVSTGTSNTISNRIIGTTTPQSWWSTISKGTRFGSSLLDVLAKHPNDLILIALSRPYIEMIHHELLQIAPNQGRRLRFFGKNLDNVLPALLSNNWMPYDDRLDFAGIGCSGTQADFAQRSLRHFVGRVLPDASNDSCAEAHRTAVLTTLENLEVRKAEKRTRIDDVGIDAAIRDNWEHGKGQSSALLRILRHEIGIACEQSRFRKIYHAIKKTMETAS